MSYGYRKFSGVPAKFSGVAEIGVAALLTVPTNMLGGYTVVTDNVKTALIKGGWKVVRVSIIGNQILAVVTGSTSDNLTTVAKSFKTTLAKYGNLTVTNVTAERGNISGPALTPAQLDQGTTPLNSGNGNIETMIANIQKELDAKKAAAASGSATTGKGLEDFLSKNKISVTAAVVFAVVIGGVLLSKK